jgi:glycosyltransferase involved in cell wall biosynthesis
VGQTPERPDGEAQRAAAERVTETVVRILHLMTFVNGAAGRAVVELAAGQKRTGHHVTVVTSKTAAGGVMNHPVLMRQLGDGGVFVHAVDSLASRQTGPNADVVQFIHDHLGTAAAFDVLHTHGTVPSVIAIAAARKVTARVPILQTSHEWTVSRPGGGRQAYDLEVMNLVDRAVVPTWSVAEHFVSRGVVRRQLAVVPYGVLPDPPPSAGDMLEREMRAWRAAGGLVLCYVSATTTTHDERMLLHALPFVDVRLKILCVVFGGQEPRSTAAWPTDGPVTVRVAPKGAVVRRYSHHADFLVLPSGDGEQPLAVLEAFCDQVPVVACRVPELSEFIEDGQTGWLFDPADARALADTITLARSSAPHALRALCQRARVRYQQEFTIDRMVTGYMREYARLG